MAASDSMFFFGMASVIFENLCGKISSKNMLRRKCKNLDRQCLLVAPNVAFCEVCRLVNCGC